MKILKILGIILMAGVIMTFGSEIGERFSIPETQRLMPMAQARVGRPLTPVSVAGAGRRTVRRCAAGVYRCSLTEPQSLESLLVLTSAESIRLNTHQAAAPIALRM